MAKTYRGILIFVVILGIVMGLAGKKFDGYVYTNTEPRSNTECTLTQRVFDDADVLTDEEEAKLEKLIAEKEKLIGGDIVLMTTNDASLNTMEKLRDYAQNYYKENKIGWDKPIGSGAIYVDDWETRYTWLLVLTMRLAAALWNSVFAAHRDQMPEHSAQELPLSVDVPGLPTYSPENFTAFLYREHMPTAGL